MNNDKSSLESPNIPIFNSPSKPLERLEINKRKLSGSDPLNSDSICYSDNQMRSRWTWKAWTPFFLFFFYWTPQEFVDISTSIVLLPRRSIGRNCYFIPPLRTVYPKSQEKSYFHYLSLRTDQDSFLSFYLLVDLDLRIRFIYVDLFGCISAASWTKDFHIIASAFLFLANRCEKTTLFFSVLLIVLTIVLSSDFTTKNRNGSLFLTEKRNRKRFVVS